MKSESIAALAKALSLAQASMQAAELNSVNPFLHNRYADLGSVIEAARPSLAAHGLSFSQLIVNGEADQLGIETILLHESGEWISSLFHIHYGDEKGRSLVQSAGAVITYLRRYALAAILGVYAGDDDDGNSGPESKGKKKTESMPTTPAMTLETAMNVVNHEGTKYGELETEKLTYMLNTLNTSLQRDAYKSDEKRTEAAFKLDACKTILAARISNPPASSDGINATSE